MRRKLVMRQVLIIFSTCFLSIICKGQQNFDTLVDYHNYDELPYSVCQTQDSGYVFITSGDDYPNNTYWIEFNKLNKDGSIAFKKTFGYLGYQLYVGLSNSLKPTFDGGWVFGGGLAYPQISNRRQDGMLVKYSAVGDTEFVKIFGDTSENTIYDCIQTSDSGFALVGNTTGYHPSAGNDFWIVKTAANGNELWERTLGTNKDEQAFHVIENASHQLVVSGAKETINTIHFPYVAVYDLQGNLITNKSFNQGALTCAGGDIWGYGSYEYTLIGCLDTVININDASYPQYVARLDSSFNFKWRAVYNASESKEIAFDKGISDGGIILVGYKVDSITGWPVGWIAKVDSSGNKLWEHFYYRNPNRLAVFTDFQETFDHGFIVCGETYGDSSQDSWIVKLDSNGCLDHTCILNTDTHELTVSDLLFTVFPNPANDNVTIVTDGEKGSVRLFDLIGNEVLQRIIEGEKQTILNTSFLTSGIYFMQFRTGKKLFTAKIVKE